MNKRKLAQERNYFKFRISGIGSNVNPEILTEQEKILYNNLLIAREALLYNFDENSRIKGLNVPKHRCFCGREGKYPKPNPSLYITVIPEKPLFCWKHSSKTE